MERKTANDSEIFSLKNITKQYDHRYEDEQMKGDQKKPEDHGRTRKRGDERKTLWTILGNAAASCDDLRGTSEIRDCLSGQRCTRLGEDFGKIQNES